MDFEGEFFCFFTADSDESINILFMHSLNQYLPDIYHVPGLDLDTKGAKMKKRHFLTLKEMYNLAITVA